MEERENLVCELEENSETAMNESNLGTENTKIWVRGPIYTERFVTRTILLKYASL